MSAQNPFPGLRPFEAAESHLFFGRETATDELIAKLRSNRLIAVIGTSGSGKSSLVRAGMLPDLHGGNMASAGSDWRIAVMRPGNAPIHALAATLVEAGVCGSAGQDAAMQEAINETVLRRSAGGLIEVVRQARIPAGCNLLVVADQFEELFRLTRSQDNTQAQEEATAFVKLLLAATAQVDFPIYVVLTMRSEYLGDCTQFRDLPEAINRGQYLIPRMTRDQKRLAIYGPVAVGGGSIAPRLIQRLLNDVGDNPDQLPIMQHAMMRTWEYWQADHRSDEPIDLQHFNATGGMQEALSRHADEAFEELSEGKHKRIAELIFKRLTGMGRHNRETRFPTPLKELCSITRADEATLIRIIEVFRREGRSFLMPSPPVPLSADSLIDISHESLIRIWQRLQQWVDEEAQSARIYQRLSETAALYRRKQAGLWRDPDLQIALAWRKKNKPNQVWGRRYNAEFSNAMAFLDKSRSAARRIQILTRVLMVLLPLALFGHYVYDLNAELKVKDTELERKTSDILNMRSTVSNSDEILKDLEKDLNKDPELAKVRGAIARKVKEARTDLQKSIDQVDAFEQSDEAIVVELTPVTVDGPIAKAKATVSASQAKGPAAGSMTQGFAKIIDPERDFLTCKNVSALNPENCGHQFKVGERIYLFSRVSAPRNESLALIWYRDEQPYASRKLMVKMNPGGYRTFAWKRFSEPGHYRVELFNRNRESIAERTFTIQ